MNPVIKTVIIQIVLILVIIIWLIPAYTMIINSFKSNTDILTSKALIPPTSLSFVAFREAWDELRGPVINSILVILPVSIISTVLGSMAAYYFDNLSTGFSRLARNFGTLGFVLVALGTFIPYQATLMPLTRFMVRIGGLGTYWGLVFAYLIFYLPTGALLMSIFMAVVPSRLTDAARMDGASDLRIFFKVIMPAVMPGFIATLIFIFIMSWNVFFLPLVLVTNPSSQLISVAVDSFTGGFGTLYNETFSAAIIASFVPLILFIFLGRYFIRGLMALGSGGKGV
ncbi:MAG: glucose ABC transporter permease GlcU [Thermoplasmatales archaeon]